MCIFSWKVCIILCSCAALLAHAGQHLESKRREEWKDAYIDYRGLKDLIKACAHEAETGEASFSPRTTSLTIARYNNRTDSAEERFFTKLEGEVSLNKQNWGMYWVSKYLKTLCHLCIFARRRAVHVFVEHMHFPCASIHGAVTAHEHAHICCSHMCRNAWGRADLQTLP